MSRNHRSVAVLVGNGTVHGWERDALEAVAARSDLELSHVVFDGELRTSGGPVSFACRAVDQLRSYPLWSLLGLVRQVSGPRPNERQVPIERVSGVHDAEWLYCDPEPADGLGRTLPDPVVDDLESADVAVRFGFGVLKGRVLRAPTHGVLSFHIGDIREYRGQPGGFWEFLEGEDEVRVTLQRLTETLDGGEIVDMEPVDIADAGTWQEVRRRATGTARTMLAPGIQSLTDDSRPLRRPDSVGDLYTIPTGREVLRYFLKNSSGRVRQLTPV